MRLRRTQVSKKLMVLGAAGVEEGIAEDRETDGVEVAGRDDAMLVGGLGEVGHGWHEPSGVDGDRTEGVPQQVKRHLRWKKRLYLGKLELHLIEPVANEVAVL
jgi:hypothetical protein